MPVESRWKTFEEWKEFGIENGFYSVNPNSLKKNKNVKIRAWYNKGRYEKWLKKFEFQRIKGAIKWNEYEQWEKYGLKQGFNERNPNGLRLSKKLNERAWYGIGNFRKWLDNFEFKRIQGKWKELSNALENAVSILKEKEWEFLPSFDVLQESGYGGLVNAIYKNHGGLVAFREKLREYMGKPSNENQLENLLKEYLGGSEDE